MLRCAQHDSSSMTVLFYCCAMGLAVNIVSRSGITWRFEKLYMNQGSEVIMNQQYHICHNGGASGSQMSVNTLGRENDGSIESPEQRNEHIQSG